MTSFGSPFTHIRYHTQSFGFGCTVISLSDGHVMTGSGVVGFKVVIVEAVDPASQ